MTAAGSSPGVSAQTCGRVGKGLIEGEPDRLCSLPVRHVGTHYDPNLGVRWDQLDPLDPASVAARWRTPAAEGDGTPGTALDDLRAEREYRTPDPEVDDRPIQAPPDMPRCKTCVRVGEKGTDQ